MTGFSPSRFSICGAFLGVYSCVFVYLCQYWIFVMNIIKYSIYCVDNFYMTVLFLSHPFLSDVLTLIWISSVQFIHSVVSNSLWPHGLQHARLPRSHQLLEFTQTHVHWVGDAIQPSHLLSSPSPPTYNLSQHQGLLNESVFRIRWPEYWHFLFSISPSQEYSGLISFRMDLLDLLPVQGTLKRILQHHSLKASILTFLYRPTLTTIHDYRKNHSFDHMDLC